MSSSRVEAELRKRVAQQEVVADLGDRVLDTDDSSELLTAVSDAVRTALDADACRFFERLPHGDRAVCREANGWTDERAPTTVATESDGSLVGYTLQHQEPIVVDDLRAEDRFDSPDRLLEHGARSSLCVPVGPDDEPLGVLEAHTAAPQAFDEADAAVLRTIANVLATAFETTDSELLLDEKWTGKEQFLERSPVGITVVDTNGKMQFANQRAEEILGRSREEIGEFTHDDSRWGLIDTDGTTLSADDLPFNRVFDADESITDMEVGVHQPDGTRIWLSIDGTPLRSDGTLTGGVFALTDVTEQKRLENEFEEMLDRVTDAFYALDDEFRFTHVNDRAEELLQHSERELLGERLWDVFPEAADEAEVWDSFQTAMDTQEPTSYELYFDPLDFWVEANLYPSQSGVSVYFRDITAQKEREQELEQYRALTEAAQDVVVTIDEESTIRSVNPAVEDVFGYDRDALVGESLTTLMPDRLENGHFRALEQYLETGERTLEWEYVELPGLCADGSEIPLAVSFSEVEYERERFFTGILRDITERKAHERRMREERDLTNRIVETSPTGIITVGPDGSFERVNERAEEIMGYSGAELEELVGGTAGLDPVKPDGEQFSAEEIPTQRVLADGETIHDLEIGLLRADGERVWLSLSGTPLWDDGESSGAVFTFADITERKRMEADLRASEQKFRQVAENLEQVIWMSTPHKGEMLYVNPAYEEIWGRSCESLYRDPESFFDGIHPDDRDRVREALPKQPGGEYDETYRVVRPDGEVRWVRDRAVPIHDEDGDVYRIVGIASDITEQRTVERELRERERELSTLMSNVPGMVYRCRNERGWPMKFVSDGCEELTGYNPTALERDEVQWGTDIVAEQDQVELWEHIQTNIDDREPFSATYRIETAAGNSRWVKETGRAIFEDGAIEAIEGVVIDITERKEYQQRLEETNERLVRANERLERSNERLEKSNERLEHFAYATSHDLQEPLRMVSSYLRLIESRYGDVLDEEGEEFLEFAVDGADRMREMIDGLLTYSRIETQGQPLESVALNDVVDDVRTDLQLQFEESNAALTVADLPRVEGDPSQLRQLFQNLFDNAIEYSGDEPPTIDVSAERAGEMWVVSVSDRGIGIPADDTAVIFEVFERLHTIDEHEGTGIGLALCQRIVERHGGEIWVDSEPGEGSTFSVTLPAVTDDQP
ncbi:diguanylate cyclase [Natronococcus pandeyae]|uniref:histidine kinase n=1 Tax=Natronococcus pandeyae TaxID=2055836 RepID=A0A8J8Q2C6_9EURY|nr:PAS domain S-box protein [Natronococcus pandeyae]TYL38855.1 diguanylate cyclase [Natronococcus pandeyae]